MQTIATPLKKVTSIQFTFALYAFAFAIPLFFSSPQVITGTLVNCFLFLAAQRLSNKEIIPLIVLPSLGALAHGILFGPQTVFIYYFLPFIWIGNYTLVMLFSTFPKQSYVMRVGISAVTKYLILYLLAQLYFKFGIIPALFVSSMGYIQLITALIGGVLAYGITSALNYERT